MGKREKHKESSDKVWDNQQVQKWFKKSAEECYAVFARNNLPRLLFLLCIAYVPLRDDKENSALKLKTFQSTLFLGTKPCSISVQATSI